MRTVPNLRLLCVLAAVSWLAAFPAGVRAQFTDWTYGPLGMSGAGFGAAWGDYDKDGDEDLYCTNGSGPSHLLRQDPGHVFVEIVDPPLPGFGADMGAAWADYNNDGALDLYVTNGNWSNRLLSGLHGGGFVESDGSSPSSGLAQSAAWGDYDRDGLVDLFVSYWGVPNKLFRNLGGGTFANVTPPSLADPGKNSGVAWGDYDNDGDLDLFVGGRVTGKLFRNNGGGTFVDVTNGGLIKTGTTGAAWGDYDNDGDLDLYITRDLGTMRLFRNESYPDTTLFIDMNVPVVRISGNGQGVSWLEADNDGDLDLFVAVAGVDNASGAANVLFRNNGGGSFTNISAGDILTVGNSRGVAVADYDQNGTQDVYIMNWGGPNQLLKNVHPTVQWLEVNLVGTVSNKSAIGARVRVKSGGKWQMREVSGGSGIYSENSLIVHFGLGNFPITVDSLTVQWPSGNVTVLTGIASAQRLDLAESGLPVGIGDTPRDFQGPARLFANAPNPFARSTTIRYELGRAAPVALRVLDVTGRVVRVLENSSLRPAGAYQATWNGQDDRGEPVARGVYFYSLDAGGYRETRRLIFLP